MPRAVLVVQTRPSDPSREDDFNRWYDETHIPEVLAIPGIVGARRYRLSETQQVNGDRSYPYLAVYDLDADDLDTVVDELRRRMVDGTIHPTDALERTPPPRTSIYEVYEP
jgi:hypothetical protein